VNYVALPPGIVGIPFFEESAWWYVGAYVSTGTSWQRLYSRGPMWLTKSAAHAEWMDTVDAFWGRSVFLWKWTGAHWKLEAKV
jgi:hypothetical protein